MPLGFRSLPASVSFLTPPRLELPLTRSPVTTQGHPIIPAPCPSKSPNLTQLRRL